MFITYITRHYYSFAFLEKILYYHNIIIFSCVYGMKTILIANGTYELAENIKVGDQVMTYNFTTNSEQSGNVTKIDVTNESEMYIINGILYLAPDQYVWKEQGWIIAENLTYNDTIYNVFTGYYDPVSSIIAVNGTFQMYDFTVNINGNYISFAYILKDLELSMSVSYNNLLKYFIFYSDY